MKNLKLILTVVFSSVLMLSCMTQNSKASTETNLQREWMMVSFNNYSKEKLTKYEAKMSLVPSSDRPNQFSAKMGCNNMFFTAKVMGGNKVEFSEVGSTMMYCQDMMDVESDFAKSLPMMSKYQVDGHYLTLSDENGNKMKFVAADWD